MNFEEAKIMLEEHGQQHLLKFYDESSDKEKSDLLKQIENLDFSVLESLKPENISFARERQIEPLTEAVTIEDAEKNADEYTGIGLEQLKQGKVAMVLLAGGQGTRLGFDKPKGMFNIGVSKELYIFECLINNMLDVVKQAGCWIPLLIMTSEKNNTDTVSFFNEHNFFGYNPDYVHFFVQDMAVSVDFDGKIYLESKSRLSLSPNGNGGWFSSIVKSGLLDKIKADGAEWLNVFSVDNVLQRMADPKFIGAVISTGCQSGSKVVSKANPQERVGAMCLENGMPSIVEYYELTDEMANQRLENGELAYRFGVTLNYLFRLDKLEEINNKKLPVHIVEKKIPYIDENGVEINPDEPNGYKFETLILDMVNMYDSCLPFEVVRRKEFAPVKNASGTDSVDTARELLKENGVEI